MASVFRCHMQNLLCSVSCIYLVLAVVEDIAYQSMLTYLWQLHCTCTWSKGGNAASLLYFSGLFKHSQTISKAYLAEVIPPDKRASVYGQFNAVSSIGFIVGPTVGGHLAELSSSGFFLVGLLSGSVFLASSGRYSLLLFQLL